MHAVSGFSGDSRDSFEALSDTHSVKRFTSLHFPSYCCRAMPDLEEQFFAHPVGKMVAIKHSLERENARF